MLSTKHIVHDNTVNEGLISKEDKVLDGWLQWSTMVVVLCKGGSHFREEKLDEVFLMFEPSSVRLACWAATVLLTE